MASEIEDFVVLEPDFTDEALRSLHDRIRAREATVAVVGLGYVGLPLLIAVAEAGFPVIGYEADPEKVALLRAGRSYIADVADGSVASLEDAEFSHESAVLRGADVMVICVPTPLADFAPDLSLVRRAAEDAGRRVRPGTLVILESTTYPGTTQEILAPALESHSGLVAGRDFAVAYSPERIDPGQTDHRLENTPKIVAGLTPRCRDLAAEFYGQLVSEVVTVSSPREAEMAKLVENTFRQVNIALVNELAIMARELDVDIWESLRAAATKPFGYMPFWPGPGVGGHCISIDPSYLSWLAGQQLGYRIGFVEHANEVNKRMPAYVVDRVAEALNDHGKAVRNSRILCLGVAYKAGVNDLRESPSLEVLHRLQRRGACITYYDPYVPELDTPQGILFSTELLDEVVGSQDCVVILTPHAEIDLARVVAHARLVFDSRGVTRGLGETGNVISL
jgi:UDP-N-acetyl-D-glucosamine dehydrogenase